MTRPLQIPYPFARSPGVLQRGKPAQLKPARDRAVFLFVRGLVPRFFSRCVTWGSIFCNSGWFLCCHIDVMAKILVLNSRGALRFCVKLWV
ncbi:MAG: hypothetical protein N4A53_14520, partial [Pelagimonas sp.]|nr:hypothetical protein [Pelagimonas sp.]